MAEVEGEAVGFALFFPTFSTFRGRPGIYLEDLFVEARAPGPGHRQGPARRGGPPGRRARCGRLEWSVLDWNAPAIAFYEAAGARPLDDWTIFRIDDDALRRLASS